jgi:uncharacterized membrane protein YphA (DoxX/SURF4 family)
MQLRNIPTRVATGAFILHSGIEKWNGGHEQAAGLQQMAAGAFPEVEKVQPPTFLRALAIAEIATGAVLLAPFVSPIRAGAALTAFSGGLVTLYARTPSLRQPNSIWPSEQGLGVSKDIWMLGIGLGLVLGGIKDNVDKVTGAVSDKVRP